ncbi:sensor histidine kinase [Streptomyces sp. MUM 203J]|uniref:sensor histidine kinase n=1 Tax=Streptomyces sp. MUM 203J TaxID=2791990 RepID=UPI001F037192|nr:sensor histidine kinase [Streptomyces sp. MUM 203J]MCH0538072.1 sensor histidine kinase [Streptomyces sp. MUM 203J]
MRTPRPRLPRSLAGQLFAMQVVLVAAVVAGCAVFVYVTDRQEAEATARRQVTATATAVARSPAVVAAARADRPTALLQPYADALTRDGGVTFVVIMAPDGTRWTHPEPDRIGGAYLGHIGPAQRGETLTETYEGTLGPSVRTVTPVWDRDRIVALVSAGITIDRITEQVRHQLTALLGAAGAAVALGGAGTYVINARLRRHTHGMNAAELSRMHDYHEAALHAVREGLLMLDGRRRIALANDGARDLLGLTGENVVGTPVDALGLPPPLTEALLDPEPREDELHLTADRVLVLSTRPVVGGERRGTVATLRDHTELQALSGELDSERGFSQALRAQAHEAANRLHTVVSLIELGRAEEAVEFATAELELAQALTDRVVAAVGEPVLAALLLGKSAQASERGVELVLTEDSRIDDGVLPRELPSRDLVTVLGNLLDNAVEAAQGSPSPRVTVTARVEPEGQVLLRVADSGPGVAPEDREAVFTHGWTTRGPGRGTGLALVRQAVHRARGSVELGVAPQGGACFTVRLPASCRARTPAARERGPGAAPPVPAGGVRRTAATGRGGGLPGRRAPAPHGEAAP